MEFSYSKRVDKLIISQKGLTYCHDYKRLGLTHFRNIDPVINLNYFARNLHLRPS